MRSVPTKGPSESRHGDISNTLSSVKEEKPKDRTKPCQLKAFLLEMSRKATPQRQKAGPCCLGLVVGVGLTRWAGRGKGTA